MNTFWKIPINRLKKWVPLLALFLWMAPVLMGATPINPYNGVSISVANDSGTRFDYGGNDVYYVNFKSATQGLNAIHIAAQSSDMVGVDFTTSGTSGTFYITDSGGKGYDDEIILLVSINANSLPTDFSLSLQASGYQVTVDSTYVVTQSNYATMEEQFGPEDFIYGPQTWKPAGAQDYPLWIGEDISVAANSCLLMFVDLYVGIDSQTSGLTDNGQVRVDYQFENLPAMAAFNAYGYRILTNGDIEWTNRTSGTGSSGWRVTPVSNLPADVYDDYQPPRHSVDGDDLIWMALHYGTTPADPDWDSRCDIVANAVIDDADVNAMLASFGATY